MLVGLADGYDVRRRDPTMCCAAILTGAGGHFSLGRGPQGDEQPPTSEYVERRMAEEPNLHWKALLRDYRCSKPLIAAVEGYAVAGGTEMLQGTDIRVAGDGAIFGVWEGKRGLFPLGGSACRLPRQIPYTHRDGHPPHVAPGARARGEGDRAHQPRRPRRPRAEHRDGDRATRSRRAARCPSRRSCAAWRETEHHQRCRGDAAPGQDRLGGVRERGRAGGPARVRREARARLQGPIAARSAVPNDDAERHVGEARRSLTAAHAALARGGPRGRPRRRRRPRDGHHDDRGAHGRPASRGRRRRRSSRVRPSGAATATTCRGAPHRARPPRRPRRRVDLRRRRARRAGGPSSRYEGPPGYVHGGCVALAFDELLGMVNVLNGLGGLTGKLTVRYRRPDPARTWSSA